MHLPLSLSLPFLLLLLLPKTQATHQTPLDTQPNPEMKTGNPLNFPSDPKWYADPEAHLFHHTGANKTQNYWIYPTYSAAYESQTFFDAFSSPDLVTWTKYPRILDITRIPWSTNRAAWAPSVARRRVQPLASQSPAARANSAKPNPNSQTEEEERGEEWKYYMYFSTGDGTGIGVAQSSTNTPSGPFEDALGEPLVNGTVLGAEAIDAQIFVDKDSDTGEETGRVWLYFGGWGHAVVVEVDADSMVALKGEFVEITPPDYVEGPWVFRRGEVYYFMYSVGGWGDNSYGVSYVTGSSPTGPFTSTPTKILQGDDRVGTSTGHNSVLTVGDEYYIVYHRRYLNDTERDHRVVCIDRMEFDALGNILPVKITVEGVDARPL